MSRPEVLRVGRGSAHRVKTDQLERGRAGQVGVVVEQQTREHDAAVLHNEFESVPAGFSNEIFISDLVDDAAHFDLERLAEDRDVGVAVLEGHQIIGLEVLLHALGGYSAVLLKMGLLFALGCSTSSVYVC